MVSLPGLWKGCVGLKLYAMEYTEIRVDANDNCPMSAQQVKEYGEVLGQAGCALNMWRYEREYFVRSDIQSAVRDIAATLGRLSRKPCLRS